MPRNGPLVRMAFLLRVTALFTVVTTAGSPTPQQEAVRAGEVEPGSRRTGREPDVLPGRAGHRRCRARSAFDVPGPDRAAAPAEEPVVLGRCGQHHRRLPRRGR